MNIYEGKVGLGARLGEAFDHYNQRDPDTDYMLVVHTDTPDQSVDDDLPEWNKDFHCKGVLYVRGVRFGGVSSEQRDKVKENYKSGWVHFLSYAVGLNDKLPFPEQFQRFFAEVRERDRIDWSIIEPAWPENLVALYLLSRVLDHLNRRDIVKCCG